VPGIADGEGCSTAGGCTTCPFMEMNNLDASQDIIEMVDQGEKFK
jgi:quinolinate synthase